MVLLVMLLLMLVVITWRLLYASAMLSETEIVFSLRACVSMQKLKKNY